MQKFLQLVALLFLVLGCNKGTGYVGEVVMPDGGKGYAVSCDATKTKCYQQAGRFCPNGYTIKDDNGMDTSKGSAAVNGWSGSASHESKRLVGMVIHCNPPGAAAAPPPTQSSVAPPSGATQTATPAPTAPEAAANSPVVVQPDSPRARIQSVPTEPAAPAAAVPVPAIAEPENAGEGAGLTEQGTCLRMISAGKFQSMAECRCVMNAATNGDALKCGS